MPNHAPAFRPRFEQLEPRDVPSISMGVGPYQVPLWPVQPAGSLVFQGGTDGQLESTAARFVTSGSGGLNRSIGAAFGPDVNGDAVGELYVASWGSDQVMRYDGATGAPYGLGGNPASAVLVTAGLGGLDNPEFLTFGPDGNLYVVSSTTAQVFRYHPVSGALVDVFVTAADNGPLEHPLAAAFGPDGHLYVTGANSSNVVRFNGTTGAYLSTFVAAGSGGLNRPETLAFRDGRLYVASSASNQVLRYDAATGAFTDVFVSAAGGLSFPTGLAFGPDGRLYVGGAGTANVRRYDGTSGAYIDDFVPAGAGGLDRPTALAFGADGALYVSTADSSKVLRFDGGDGGPGDSDTYTLQMNGGQTVTLRVFGGAQTLLTLTHSVLGDVPLPADEDPGSGWLYQTIAVPADGTLTIGMHGLNGYTAGSYRLEATLNARLDGSTGTSPLVQSLDGSAVDVDPGPGAVWRRAATGRTEAAIPRYLTETEGQVRNVGGSWDRVGGTNVWSVNGSGNPAAPAAINKGVTGALDRKGNGNDSGDSWSLYAKAGDVITLRTRGSSSGGGTLQRVTVLLRDPNWTEVATGTPVSGSASDQQITFTVAQEGEYTAVVRTDSGMRGTYTLLADLTTPADPRYRPEDVYTVTVATAGRLSLAAATGGDPVTQPRVGLSLYANGVDPYTGAPLATSSPAGSLDGRLETTVAAGTYLVKVSPGAALTSGWVNYGLVAVSGGTFEASGGNGSFATAQPLAGSPAVLGSLRAAVRTFVTPGSGGLQFSEKVAFHNGDLFVVSRANNTVNRYDGTTGAPKPAAGKSGAVFASATGGNALKDPIGIAFGPDGNLYIANYGNNTVHKYNGSTGARISTFVTSGSGGLTGATGLAFGPDGHLYVASRDTDRVMRYHGSTGAPLPSAGNPGATFAVGGGLDGPDDLTFGPDGRLYVSSQFSHQVLAFDGTTGTPAAAPFVAAGSGGLTQPLGVRFGPDGSLYVTSFGTNQVMRYDGTTGAFREVYVSGGLSGSTGLAFGPDGSLYATSRTTNSVVRVAVSPDFYAVTLAAGQTLTLTTATPFDGVGAPGNALDPRLELYGPGQSLVASGTTLGDGRNERIVYVAPAAGTYFVRLAALVGTAGEYLLTLEVV